MFTRYDLAQSLFIFLPIFRFTVLSDAKYYFCTQETLVRHTHYMHMCKH